MTYTSKFIFWWGVQPSAARRDLGICGGILLFSLSNDLDTVAIPRWIAATAGGSSISLFTCFLLSDTVFSLSVSQPSCCWCSFSVGRWNFFACSTGRVETEWDVPLMRTKWRVRLWRYKRCWKGPRVSVSFTWENNESRQHDDANCNTYTVRIEERRIYLWQGKVSPFVPQDIGC